MLTFETVEILQGTFSLTADLTIGAGTITAVIGPSGAGKSTLLNAVSGFVPVTAGRLLWQGQDISRLPPAKRPVAMLFQDNNVFPHLTAMQNVGLGIRPDLRLTAQDHARVAEALDRVGLAGLEQRKPNSLSGGQQGRIALARVYVQRRPLILLDEPFAALGPALKTDMLDLVAGLAQETGATVLMVSHDPADAQHIAQMTVLVADGMAQPPAPTRALFANPPAALAAYLGS